MKRLYLDIETFSGIDLASSGVYRYSEAPDFQILLVAYSVDGDPVQVVDLASGEKLPTEIRAALEDDSVEKWAYNAQFERVCFTRFLDYDDDEFLDPESWRCAMAVGAYIGLPLGLEAAAHVSGALAQKMTEGRTLIRYFCKPCAPTMANGDRTRNLPEHDPEKWEVFKEYCTRDVEVEMALLKRVEKYPMPREEWENYWLDQRINDNGIKLDTRLMEQAILCDEQSRARLTDALKNLTNLDNPNSVAQMKAWLADQGTEANSLNKAMVHELLQVAPDDVAKVLTLRQELAKSSVRKYQAMRNVVCNDGRARGLIQFYGAPRTGRFAGRLIQVQNLPQNHLPNLEQARVLLRDGDFDALEAQFDSIPIVLSELIRTAFISRPGMKLVVADFSAIEARVLSWLAGEEWRNQVFSGDGKIYEATAARMFRVPIDSVTKDSEYRQKAKQTELACGYGGGVGALKKMGALAAGIKEEELQPLVDAWRQSNPHIVRFWHDVDRATKKAVSEKTYVDLRNLSFDYRGGMLQITLPSGRKLSYIRPRIEPNRFENESVTYEGVDAKHKWSRLESYGAKFVENIVQATSRDILCEAMQRLWGAGLSIAMHIHDEIVMEASPKVSVDAVCQLMSRSPQWAKELNLRADGFQCQFYQKG
ncbi:DNA polymerase [Clostridia bacterium]|nr:DNA polymerase [Clostridia bacterium]